VHAGAEAASEFQKILVHRGVDATYPRYALAYLGLGRARVLQGDTAKARTVYQDFFNLWKDADPDIPILKQAKAGHGFLLVLLVLNNLSRCHSSVFGIFGHGSHLLCSLMCSACPRRHMHDVADEVGVQVSSQQAPHFLSCFG
jgi:hypothetical protein